MIRSMTGYGEGERETPAGWLRAEVRTVNHRYFSANLRLVRAVERFESAIRETLRAVLPRGHVNFSLRLESPTTDVAASALRVDEARARHYVEVLRGLKTNLGLAGDVDLGMLLRLPDVMQPAEQEDEAEIPIDDVREVTEHAALAAARMRGEEGRHLVSDLETRLASIGEALSRIEARAPERLVHERDRMRRSVAELLGEIDVDEQRVHREVAFMADRLDISEEIVRLRSHLELFRGTLSANGGEPVGKRLNFLVQEMNRETNTIGSKANDAPIEHEVVAIKDDIERLREQVENVE